MTISVQGVYTNAALQLGKLLDSAAFKVWSTALAIMLVITWLLNMVMTIKGTITGSLLGLDQQVKSNPSRRGDTEQGHAEPDGGMPMQQN